jgi:hypothetical protein
LLLSTKAHHALWTRLHDLNKRKDEIEGQILASVKVVEKETSALQQNVHAALMGRAIDLRGVTEEVGR